MLATPSINLRRVALSLCATTLAATAAQDYVILVSKPTRDIKEWANVVNTLTEKHAGAHVIQYDTAVSETLPDLKKSPPRWLCWIARPDELGTKNVREIHRLARTIDDDPYPDVFWGIVTGYDAKSARALAAYSKPLIIYKLLGNTEIASDCTEQCQWFSELNQGEVWTKKKNGPLIKSIGHADSTPGLVNAINQGYPDAIITSGHATENDWQPGFRYRNGFFTHQAGTITGKPLDGSSLSIHSPNPKVYLGIGNCLLGNVPNKPDCMATAWMKSGGVHQFLGYTVPTWFGYAGWGVLDYFIEQPARFSLTESFTANLIALDWNLTTTTDASTKRGLTHDRDVVAFYGDPAWDARLAPGSLRWTESFKQSEPGVFTWTITPTSGPNTFTTVNANGSQRGGRPLVRFLPQKFHKIELLDGKQWKPVLADDFILVPRPADASGPMVIRIKAQ